MRGDRIRQSSHLRRPRLLLSIPQTPPFASPSRRGSSGKARHTVQKKSFRRAVFSLHGHLLMYAPWRGRQMRSRPIGERTRTSREVMAWDSASSPYGNLFDRSEARGIPRSTLSLSDICKGRPTNIQRRTRVVCDFSVRTFDDLHGLCAISPANTSRLLRPRILRRLL